MAHCVGAGVFGEDRHMDRPEYFQTALSNFATDVACGGAIRHLTNSGCTLEQIVARLDYPTSREKVRRIMMEHLYQSRVLLRKEPSDALFEEQTQFVQEQDAYGRRTLRKVKVDYDSQDKMTDMPDLTELSQRKNGAELKAFPWKEIIYDPKRDGKLTEMLYKKCEENGTAYSYMSCDFALFNIDSKSKKEETPHSNLNNRQREYLAGIRWEKPVLYHRLDQRMREILGKLYDAGVYSGVCFFAVRREKIIIPLRTS